MLISDQAKFFVKNCFEGGGSSLLLRRFVFRMAEASAKRVTGDEPQGTMGRVQQCWSPMLFTSSQNPACYFWERNLPSVIASNKVVIVEP